MEFSYGRMASQTSDIRECSIFCPLKKVISLAEKIREPCIISFNHSRPDDPVAFSGGGGFQDTNPHYHYQQPAYLKSTSRYSPEFDYL